MVQGLQNGNDGMYHRTMTVALFLVLYNYVPMNETKNKGTLALQNPPLPYWTLCILYCRITFFLFSDDLFLYVCLEYVIE